ETAAPVSVRLNLSLSRLCPIGFLPGLVNFRGRARRIQSPGRESSALRSSQKPVEMRTCCPPRDNPPTPIGRFFGALSSIHIAENTQVNHQALDWNETCLLITARRKERARNRDTHRKLIASHRLQPRQRRGCYEPSFLALPSVVRQKCLSLCEQRGGCGRCGSRCTPVGVPAHRPVSRSGTDIHMVNGDCVQFRAHAVAQAPPPNPRVTGRIYRRGAGTYHGRKIGGLSPES